MILLRCVACFVLVIVISSCAPMPAGILLDTEQTPSDVLLEHLRERAARVKSLNGRGIVSFDTPEISGSASFEANMKKPDSLLVLLEGPLGIDVGTLFLSREKFVVYNSLDNTVMTGNPDNARIRSLIPINLSYDQIMDAFSGIVPAPADGDTIRAYTIADDQFFLETTCGEHHCKFWIDPKYVMVTRYEMRNASDAIVMEAKLSAFTTEAHASIPKRITITMPQESRRVTIAYRSLNVNPPDTDFRYRIPSNARILISESGQ